MIVVDIETSGVQPDKNGVWQIGAIDFYNPENTFFGESSIDEEDAVSQEALNVIGKTEEDLRTDDKKSQKELLESFFEWARGAKIKNMLCQGSMDYWFLFLKAKKYGLKFPFHARTFDLHSMAQTAHFMKNGEFLFNNENAEDVHSDMGLNRIAEIYEVEEEKGRRLLSGGKVVREGSPHNALEDAKIEAECLRKLLLEVKEQ